jgi:glyoxylase-like metal-dependent hydrolase (beta-lactamase superfamily II)
MSSNATFKYDVFVSDPTPQNVPEPLPNGEPHVFSPLSSTLISGDNDAVLTDPPLTIEQGRAVGDWIEATGKKLTHIFATHGHGDHWFTAGMLSERFGAQVVASAGTIEQMHGSVSVREILWDKLWPGQIPPTPVTAVAVSDNRLTLEGHDLLIVDVGHSDTDDSTVLHVPDLGLVVAGDVIYNGVHQYLGESANGGRDGWRKAIDTVAALAPRWAVAGHKNKELDDDATRVIPETRRYLDAVDELLPTCPTAVDFFNAMVERFPDRVLGRTTLWAGTRALYAWRERHGDDAVDAGDDVLEDSLAGWL